MLLIDDGGVSFQIAIDIVKAGANVLFLTDLSAKPLTPVGILVIQVESLSLGQLFAFVDNVVVERQPDVVLTLSEEFLISLWDANPPWISLVEPAIKTDNRDLFRSKHVLSASLQKLGVKIPKMLELNSGTLQEIEAAMTDFDFPVVVKGARGSGGKQVRVVDSVVGVEKAVSELFHLSGCNPALQQYIEGATYQVAGVFNQGSPLNMFAAIKSEMLPPITGPSIALISCDEKELMQTFLKIMALLGHTGFAGGDFIRGPQGEFYFLELNPRIWGSYGFCRELGIDLFGTWLRLQRKETQTAALKYPFGRSWVKMPDYLFAAPKTKRSVLRRLVQFKSIRCWGWYNPYLLLHQLRTAIRVFRKLS